MRCIFLSMFIFLLVTGCASKPYVDDPGKSFALNRMKAIGASADLRDSKEWPQNSKLVDAGIAGGLAAGSSMSSLFNISSGLAGGLWALDSMLSNNDGIEANSIVFTWVEQDGRSADQIRKDTSDTIKKALFAALNNTNWPEEVVVSDVTPQWPYQKMLEGGQCKGDFLCGYGIGSTAKPKEVLAPSALGGQKSWLVVSYLSQQSAKRINEKLFSSDRAIPTFLPDFEVYRHLSESLPKGYFVYLAPHQEKTRFVSLRTEQGFTILRAPVLLDQGNIHLFVKPQ